MTMPSDVVTKPWLQHRIWVSTKQLMVSCIIMHLLFVNGDAGSVRVPWRMVNRHVPERLCLLKSAIHFLGRDRQVFDPYPYCVCHSVGDGRCYRPNRVLPNALGVVGSGAVLRG